MTTIFGKSWQLHVTGVLGATAEETLVMIGESVAHLHALWFVGKLRREFCSDGVYRFTTV